jgi:hypothetical protein
MSCELTNDPRRKTAHGSWIMGYPEVMLRNKLFNYAGQKSAWRKSQLISSKPVSEAPTIRESTLLGFALPRLADREQENGTLVLCVR